MGDGIDLRLFDKRREPSAYTAKYFEDYEARIRGSGYWHVMARLKPGVTLEHARQSMHALSLQVTAKAFRGPRSVLAEVRHD